MSNQGLITVILIVGVAIFVQYNGYNRHFVPTRWFLAWKTSYKELKIWTERMGNVDINQLNKEQKAEEGCYTS